MYADGNFYDTSNPGPLTHSSTVVTGASLLNQTSSISWSRSSSLTFTFLQNLNRLSHLQSQTLSHRAPEAADHCGERERQREGKDEKIKVWDTVMKSVEHIDWKQTALMREFTNHMNTKAVASAAFIPSADTASLSHDVSIVSWLNSLYQLRSYFL